VVALPAVLLVIVVAVLLLPQAAGSGGSPSGPIAGQSPSPSPIDWGSVTGLQTVTWPSPTPSPTPEPTPDLSGYVWPLRNARVTLPFGPSRRWGEFIVDGKLFHDGLDMATQCGDRVMAAHAGVVLAAGRHFDDFVGWRGDLTAYYDRLNRRHSWGYLPIVVVIDDGNGLRSIYAHESRVVVKPGQRVKAGQVIGYEGMTGNASGCHVHFGLFDPTEPRTFELNPTTRTRLLLPRYETARIDPLLVLPYRNEIEEMRALRPEDAAAWDAEHNPKPSPSPTHSPSPTASPPPTPALTPYAG
jgi:murein DD-endopeptidase MepM/ murein hydrolase activator NlpD